MLWIVFSLIIGVVAAAYRDTWIDKTLMIIGLIGISMPVYGLGEVMNLLSQSRLHDTWLFSWVPPQAGLIGLARLSEGIDSDAFARFLLAPPYCTFLLPGSAYELPGHIRLGVGGGAGVRLEDGLDRLSQALHGWKISR